MVAPLGLGKEVTTVSLNITPISFKRSMSDGLSSSVFSKLSFRVVLFCLFCRSCRVSNGFCFGFLGNAGFSCALVLIGVAANAEWERSRGLLFEIFGTDDICFLLRVTVGTFPDPDCSGK